MDLALLTLTVVSLVAAAGFGAVAWRALDEQRRRSAARVAALASAIDRPLADMNEVTTTADVAAGVPLSPAARTGIGPGASRLTDRSGPVAVSSMFRTTEGAMLKGRPLIKAAVVAAMAVTLIVVAAMANRDHDTAASGLSRTLQQESAPLELISMRHTREGSTLTVAGLVRNPRAGTAVTRIAAVVFAFDRHGSFVASARAPLDFTTLEPGDESPFVVTIPGAAVVSRYRVSFRTDAGVLRHVDRRAVQVARRSGGPARPEA